MKDFVYVNSDIEQQKVIIRKKEVGIVFEEYDAQVLVQFVNHKQPLKVPKSSITRFDCTQTGDGYKEKVCNRCNRLLPIKNFQKNQNGKNNRSVRRPSCNECRKIIDGAGVSNADKKIWESKKPNFDVWECPICKKRTIPGLTSKVVLDHDHKTGKPRAWICDSCNTGLGRFKDDIHTMEMAIKYLKDTSKQ